MAAKLILVFCTQVILIQSTFGQFMRRAAFNGAPSITNACSPSMAASALTSPVLRNSCVHGYPATQIPAIEVLPTSSGFLPVISGSAYSPELKLATETEYEGTLSVGGELPFIGTVGIDGILPSSGTGFINHACGNSPARIKSSNFGPDTIFPMFGHRRLHDCYGSSHVGYLGVNENAYRGIGEGNLVVNGQIPVIGETVVAGQVPIMGTVRYCGSVPAAGSVCISAKCDCGCFCI